MRFSRNKKSTVSTRKAFGLAEVIFATAVLSIGMVAVLTPIASSIPNLTATRDFIVAGQLAEEGVGLVRNIRDNNFLNGNTFDGFPSSSDDCSIDYTQDSASCSSPQYYLKLTGASPRAFYQSSPDSQQKFSRKITLTPVTPPDSNSNPKSYDVVSYTVWKPGKLSDIGSESDCTRGNHCAYAKTVLTDWKFW